MAKERPVKIQITLPAGTAARLDKLVERTEAASMAEVTRNALRLYEAVIEETEAGNQFFLDKEGERVPVIMIP